MRRTVAPIITACVLAAVLKFAMVALGDVAWAEQSRDAKQFDQHHTTGDNRPQRTTDRER